MPFPFRGSFAVPGDHFRSWDHLRSLLFFIRAPFAEVCHPMPLGTASLPTRKCIGKNIKIELYCGPKWNQSGSGSLVNFSFKTQVAITSAHFLEIFLKGKINYLLNVAVTEIFAYQITCAPWYLLSCSSLTNLLPVKQPYLECLCRICMWFLSFA